MIRKAAVLRHYFMKDNMNVVQLVPRNSLEIALKDSQCGTMPLPQFLRCLILSELFIVSVKPVAAGDQGLFPLLFDRDGVPMAAVYTDSSRVINVTSKIESVIRMKGFDLLKRIPPGYGVVINPGFDLGLELMPEGIFDILTNCREDK
jgi:hypothetical protein